MQGKKEGEWYKKLKWVSRSKGYQYPPKRWGHSAVLKRSNMLIFGGTPAAGQKEPFFRINCETFDAEQIYFTNMLENRESHSCNLVGESFFIFGGCINQEATNDLIEVKISSNNFWWKKVEQKNPITARESHASIPIKDKYILIYGGINKDEESIKQFWIFSIKSSTWFQFPCIEGEDMRVKYGCSLSIIDKSIYLFGGDTDKDNEAKVEEYNNEIFQLSFQPEMPEELTNDNIPKLIIKKLDIEGFKPQPRTTHSAVVFRQRFLIILGGEGLVLKNGAFEGNLLNDIWFWDSIENHWYQIFTENRSMFRPRSNFSAIIHKNTIIIFGGLVTMTNFRCVDQLLTLTLNETEPVRSEEERKNLTCCICKFDYIAKKNHHLNGIRHEKHHFADNRLACNIYTIAKIATGMSLFGAFGTLIDGLKKLAPQKDILNIDYQPQIIGQNEIEVKTPIIIFKVNTKLMSQQLDDIIYNYNYTSNNKNMIIAENQERQRLIFYCGYVLKTSCLRIGRQLLFSYKFEDSISIYLLTINGIFKYCFRTSNLEVQLQQKSENRLLRQYLHYYKLKLNSMSSSQLVIRVGLLHKFKEQYEIQPKVKGGSLYMSCRQGLLINFLQEYYLDRVEMNIAFNGQPLNLQPQIQKITNRTEFDQPDPSIQKIYLCPPSQKPILTIYHQNRLLQKVKYKNYEGIIQLSPYAELDITYSKFSQSLARFFYGLSPFLKELKRNAEVSVNNLEKQVQL